MANDRLHETWGCLETVLPTGQPHNGELSESLYGYQNQLWQSMKATSNLQHANFIALARQFDFTPYDTLFDS